MARRTPRDAGSSVPAAARTRRSNPLPASSTERSSERDGYFADLQRAFRRNRERATHDISFAHFVNVVLKDELSPQARHAALAMAEGFDAVDTEPGERSSHRRGMDQRSRSSTPRRAGPMAAISVLLEAIAHTVSPALSKTQLQTVVRKITWKRGSVEIEGHAHGKPFVVIAPSVDRHRAPRSAAGEAGRERAHRIRSSAGVEVDRAGRAR